MMEKKLNLLVYCWFFVAVCARVYACVCVSTALCPVVRWYLRKVRGSEGFLEKMVV